MPLLCSCNANAPSAKHSMHSIRMAYYALAILCMLWFLYVNVSFGHCTDRFTEHAENKKTDPLKDAADKLGEWFAKAFGKPKH